jgi:HK97 family phage major capsid protein
MTERTGTQLRVFEFDVENRAAGADTIPVVISSDAVVEVSDGPEILVHTADAIDLQRAPLPIIATHRSGQVNVGVIEDITISNGRLRGNARFGTRAEAEGYKADVLNRIIRSVSVGYARVKAHIRNDGVMVTSRWMPTHTALVAEPADINAGFFRSLESVPSFELDTVSPPPKGISTRSNTMAENATQDAPAGATAEKQTAQPSALDLENQRKKAIINLCRANKIDERAERHWIESGADWTEVSEGILSVLSERSKDDTTSAAHLGLSRKEAKRYSLMAALRAAQNRSWDKAGFELECNKAIAERTNKLPRSETSFFVPLDILMANRSGQRDMTSAGVSGSNYLVTTDNQPGSFIELLRNTSVALRMGVTRLSGLQGNVTIPKMTSGNTAYWLADENTAITESQPTLGQLSLAPKNVAALTELSHQLMQQSSPDAESLVLNSIARDIGLAVDVGILRGSGASGQPTGIATTGSIGAFTGTSLAAAALIDAQADVATANALNPGCGYVTTPAVAGLLMARPELPTTGTTRMWKGNMIEGSILDFPAMSSAQMTAATMLFGWWPSVILAEWGVLELMTNPYSDFTRGLTAVRGWYTCDVGVRYAGAWSYATTIT